MSCPICTETFNASSRKQVTCLKCTNACCRSCAQRYLLELASTPHCMSCKHAWDLKFIIDNLTKTFVEKKYKDRRKDLLFDIEKSRIPSTMPRVTRFLEVETLKEENRALNKKKEALRQQIHLLNEQIWQNQHKIHHGKEKKIHAKFTQPCPVADCKGFLSTAWKCQVCKTNVCALCRELKGEDHVCNEDNVKTAALLKKDTKPCPSCGEGIFKISGCDQMWCTRCKVPFSWKTGRIVTGTVHNPHYYQFMRDNQGAVPRTPADVRCGGLPQAWQMRKKIARAFGSLTLRPQTAYGCTSLSRQQAETAANLMISLAAGGWGNNTVVTWVYTIHQSLTHFRYNELQKCRDKTLLDHENDRILYILNRMTEKKFKYNLAKKDTALRKNTDIYNIYNLVNTVCTEQFILMYNTPTQSQIFECMNVCEQLRLYANEELKKIRETYKHKIPEFDHCFRVIKF